MEKLQLFCSNTTNSATAMVIDNLGKNNTLGSRHIFIVPDRFSLSIEQEIFNRLNMKGAANIDVVSFTRLAIKELKHKVSYCLSKEGGVLVLKKVIDKNIKNLKHYTKGAKSMGFASEMYAVISSIRNNGYNIEDLENILPALERSTGAKTADIALLYREYMEELKENFDDSTTRIDKLIDSIEHSEWIKESHIYLSGFSTFSGKQMQVIEKLLRFSKSVSVALTPTNNGGNAHLFPYETLSKMTELANDLGMKYREYQGFDSQTPPFNSLNKELFAYSNLTIKEGAEKVVIYKENTVYDEMNGIAREISRLVRREGYRYKDIAIVNPNSSYNDIFMPILKRYEIPFFLDTKYPLLHTIPSRYLLSALEVLTFNFRQDKVINFIKNPLFDEDRENICGFENFVLEYGVDYNSFKEPFTFGKDYQKWERIREKIIKALPVIKGKTAPEIANSCLEFLESPSVEQSLTKELELIKEPMLVSANFQSLEKLIHLLKEISGLFEGREMDIDGFLDTLKSSLKSIEISIIPQFIDSVFIGNIRESRYNNLKIIFIMSATNDSLPANHNYKAIISATDEGMLEENGIYLYPSQRDLVREEEFLIVDLFSKVNDKIYIGYSVSKPNGESALPSEVIKELMFLLGKKEISLNKQYSIENAHDDEALIDSLVTRSNAYFQYLYFVNTNPKNAHLVARNLDNIYSSLDKGRQEMVDKLLKRKENSYNPQDELYFNKREEGGYLTKVSQLESYFTCPYRHHLQYGLKLKERKIADLNVADIGKIIHKALELYFSRTLGKLEGELSEYELKEIAKKSVEDAFLCEVKPNYAGDALSQMLLESMKKECLNAISVLTKNVQNSRFKPAMIEQGFGMGDNPLPPLIIEAEGNKFFFRGKIDRVDVCAEDINGKTYKKAIVIDYKTGSPESKISDIYLGKKIQSYIYLKALESMGYEGVGAFYQPISQKLTKEGQSYSMVGQLIDNMGIITSLDTTLLSRIAKDEVGKSDIIPVELKESKGKIAPYSSSLIEKERFQSFLDYVACVSEKALIEILEGYIAKKPLDKSGSCTYCSYQSICKDEVEEREFSAATPLGR